MRLANEKCSNSKDMFFWVAFRCTTSLEKSVWPIVFRLQHNTQQQPFYGPLAGTTRVSRYQKKHSPTHHPDHHPIFISFFHLPRYIASSLFKLRAWQSFCTISLVYLLVWSPPPHIPCISSSNQCLLFAAHAHCPYHRNLFCFSINIISSIPSLSLNSSLGTLSFTWPFLSLLAEEPPHFLSRQARSHFRVAYYFAHNSLQNA